MIWPARKWVRWALAGLAVLLLAVALAVTWLVTTEAGLRRAVTLVESVGPVRIRVEGASGRLIGPLVIDAGEIEHARASIRIAGLEARSGGRRVGDEVGGRPQWAVPREP